VTNNAIIHTIEAPAKEADKTLFAYKMAGGQHFLILALLPL